MSVGLGQPSTIGIPATHELGLEGIQLPVTHGSAYLVDEPNRPAFVVDRRQGVGKHLLRLEQVVEVGTGVMGAGVAVAALLQRTEVTPESSGVDVVAPIDGVDGGVAGHPGRVDAVEGVAPARQAAKRSSGSEMPSR